MILIRIGRTAERGLEALSIQASSSKGASKRLAPVEVQVRKRSDAVCVCMARSACACTPCQHIDMHHAALDQPHGGPLLQAIKVETVDAHTFGIHKYSTVKCHGEGRLSQPPNLQQQQEQQEHCCQNANGSCSSHATGARACKTPAAAAKLRVGTKADTTAAATAPQCSAHALHGEV